MPIQSSQVNPGALRNDYSGFAEAGRIKGQMYANLGGAIKSGIAKAHEKNQKKKQNDAILSIVDSMVDPKTKKRLEKSGIDIKSIAGGLENPEGVIDIYSQLAKQNKAELEVRKKKQAMVQIASQLPSLKGMDPEALKNLARTNPGVIANLLTSGVTQRQVVTATKDIDENRNANLVERERVAEVNRQNASQVEFDRKKEITDIQHNNLQDLAKLDHKAAEERAAIGFEYGIELGNATASHQEKRDRLQSQLNRSDLDYSSKQRIKNQLELEDALQGRKTKVLDEAQKQALSLSRELRNLEDTGQGKSDKYTEVKTALANLQKQTGIVVSDTSPRTLQDVKENWDKLSVPSRVLEVVPGMKKDDWFVYQLAIEGNIPNSEKIIKSFHETYPQFTDERGWIGRAWDFIRNNESDPLNDATRSLHLDPGVKSEIDSYFID